MLKAMVDSYAALDPPYTISKTTIADKAVTKAVASDGADDSLDIYWYVNDGNIYDVETDRRGAGRRRDRGPPAGDGCPAAAAVDGGTLGRRRRPRRADAAPETTDSRAAEASRESGRAIGPPLLGQCCRLRCRSASRRLVSAPPVDPRCPAVRSR